MGSGEWYQVLHFNVFYKANRFLAGTDPDGSFGFIRSMSRFSTQFLETHYDSQNDHPGNEAADTIELGRCDG